MRREGATAALKSTLSGVGLALAAAWLFYLVAANAFLAARLPSRLVGSGGDVTMTYRHAYTLLPGRVHLREFLLTLQDSNVQMAIGIDRADVTLRLDQLLARRVHFTRVEASEVAFRLRFRGSPEDLGSPAAEALPPIAGADPPARAAKAPEAEKPPEKDHRWTVQLENVDVAVGELWVQQFRFLGQARATGAFRLQIGRHLWVGPASLELLSGGIRAAERPLLSAVEGKIDCTIDPLFIEETPGKAFFRHLTAAARLRAEVDGLGSIDHAFASGNMLSDGSGALELDAQIDRGLLLPRTRVSYRTGRLEVRKGQVRALARGRAELRADGPEGAPLVAELELDDAQIGQASGAGTPAHLGKVHLLAHGSTVNITEDAELVSAELGVPSAHAPDLSSLPLPPSAPLMLGSGEARVAARAQLTRSSLSARLDVHASGAKADVGKALSIEAPRLEVSLDVSGSEASGLAALARLSGEKIGLATPKVQARFDLDAALRARGKLERGKPLASATLELSLDGASVRAGKREVSGLWGRASVVSPRLDPGAGAAEAKVSAFLSDARAVLAPLSSEDKLPGWVTDAISGSPLRAEGSFTTRKGSSELRIDKAESGVLSCEGLITTGESGGVVLLVEAKPASLGVSSREGHTQLAPMVGHDWLDKHRGELASNVPNR